MMRLLVLSLWGLGVSAQILAPIVASKVSCGAFAHCYTISYNHTLTGTADTSSYPALVSFSAAAMKDTGHSGDVQSTAGADILFYSDAGLTTQIASELEYYDNVNGIGWFWVNIATLSHTTDGLVYVGVGNVSPPSRTSGVWDGNYVAVWHLGSASGMLNASVGGLTLTNNSPAEYTAGTGQIDGDAIGTGSGTGLSTGSFTMGTTLTVECWENTARPSNNEAFVEKAPDNGSWALLHASSGANALLLRGGNSTNTLTATFPSSGWHYLVGTITGTSGALYVDNNAAITGTVDAVGNTNTSVFLGSVASASFELNGGLDEVRVSNIVRSSSYVLATYNNTLSPGNIGSAGFWTWAARR